jgi:hypothetical protein
MNARIMDKRRALERIADKQVGHHCVRMKSGRVLEGWIFEVGETSFMFAWAPSPFYAQATGTDEWAPPDEQLEIDDVVAYMGDAHRWVDL